MAINDRYIQIFKDFIQFDKQYVDELLDRYDDGIEVIGRAIADHSTAKMWTRNNDFMREFLDFIDGNNFIVEPIPGRPDVIYITIDWESYNAQQPQPKQTSFSIYFPVQETILSYTSVEAGTRYILELPQFFPPRPLRLRIRGCMELLRMVSESRCRSPTLPRPP